MLQALRGYARSPLQALVRRSGLLQLGGGSLAAMEQLLPELPKEAFHDSFPVVTPALGVRRYRVGLVLGCVQRVFDPTVNAALGFQAPSRLIGFLAVGTAKAPSPDAAGPAARPDRLAHVVDWSGPLGAS